MQNLPSEAHLPRLRSTRPVPRLRRLGARLAALAVATAAVGAVPAVASAGGNPIGGILSGLGLGGSAGGSSTSGGSGGLLGAVTTPVTATPAYWLVGSAGGVGAYGGTPFDGSMASKALSAPIVGSAATPDGKGYWLVASDGGIFSFGDATFYGSMGGRPLARPVVGMTPTSDGKGYWLVASDGGIFAFGDAIFRGSMGGVALARPVVGMSVTPSGRGYWMVASDGGIFAFGDAPFYGSMGGQALRQPMVGMAPVPGGGGYWTVASDGGVFSFGNAPFHGSTGNINLAAPVVGMSAPDAGGYWMVASDGGVFAFGDAPFRGSASGYVPNGEWITAMAPGPGSGSGQSEQGDFTNKVVAAGAPYAHAATGYDISWPQCGGTYPPPAQVAVVGVNNGSAFTSNPCFTSEASWGGPNLTVYLNLNSPQGSDSGQFDNGPAGACAMGDLTCESYNYGYNSAQQSIAMTQQAGHGSSTWWLDVETGNYWTSDKNANDQVIAGALAAIHQAGYAAAIYSTSYQWGQIAGSYTPSVPVWYPTGQATSSPGSWCSGSSFAGGPVYLVQSAAGSYDGDYSC